MIEVEIDLYKFGFRSLKQNLYTVKITNDGTGTKTVGNYKYKVTKSKRSTGGEIKDFKRKDKSALYLLYLVLKDRFEEKKL